MNRRSFLHAAVVMSLSRFTDEYGRSADGAERPFPLTDAEIRIRGRAGSRCGQGMPRPPKASSELPTNRQLSAFMISENAAEVLTLYRYRGSLAFGQLRKSDFRQLPKRVSKSRVSPVYRRYGNLGHRF